MCVCAERCYCRCPSKLAYLDVNNRVGLLGPCDWATRVRATVFLGLLRRYLGSRRAPHLTTTCVREDARALLFGRQSLPRFRLLYVNFTFGRRGDGCDGRGAGERRRRRGGTEWEGEWATRQRRLTCSIVTVL